MRVGLNLVYLVPGETGGMETYARELVPRLAALPGIEVVAFVNEELASAEAPAWREILPVHVVPVRARSRVQWVWGEQRHVPGIAAAARCDLVHSLASTSPLRGGFRRVTTIHDLNYRMVPGTHFGLNGLGMRVLVPAAARRSHRIIAISQATRDDLVSALRVPAARIDVVPQGVAPPPAGVVAGDPAALRRRLGIAPGRPILLSASAKRPHKNLARLLDALAQIPAERRPALVVPGYPTPYEAALREHAERVGVAADVAWPPWLPVEDLEGLYGLATCVVFPSLYEGFGLPVLEAMQRGVPVACSNRSSLPEVAGDAALLFDPEDTHAVRAAIERLLGDAELRGGLARRGRERVLRFSWDRTAERTAASYARALGPG